MLAVIENKQDRFWLQRMNELFSEGVFGPFTMSKTGQQLEEPMQGQKENPSSTNHTPSG